MAPIAIVGLFDGRCKTILRGKRARPPDVPAYASNKRGGALVDVVVIGGGLAGLTAATRASQLGAKVRLLEQGNEPEYPCNSRYAGGVMHLSYNDPERPVEELVADLRSRCPEDIDFKLVEKVARNIARALHWLRQNADAKFVKGGAKPYERLVLAPPRPAQSKLKWPGRGPDVVLRNLTTRAKASGVEITLGARVTGLRKTSAGFQVEAQGERNTLTVDAATVVIADGGFQANRELLEQNITPDFAGLLQRNAGTGLGTGIRLAESIGARLTDLGAFYGHLVSLQALQNEELWPYPYVDPLATAGMVVGPDGRRFVDESRGAIFVANAIARQKNPASFFIIFDSATWNSSGRLSKIPPNPNLERYGAKILSADTLSELATRASIHGVSLQETVRERNAAIDAGNPELMSPPRTGDLSADPIKTPPFYAVPIVAGITHTMGGLMIDTNAQVQGEDGRPIEGLFAAGTTVGGLEGGENIFYLGGLCKALTLGLLAGENAAEFVTAARNAAQ